MSVAVNAAAALVAATLSNRRVKLFSLK